jgi:hypothetical protein
MDSVQTYPQYIGVYDCQADKITVYSTSFHVCLISGFLDLHPPFRQKNFFSWVREIGKKIFCFIAAYRMNSPSPSELPNNPQPLNVINWPVFKKRCEKMLIDSGELKKCSFSFQLSDIGD